MKAKTLDRKFDAGGDVSRHLDLAKARRLNRKPGRPVVSKKLQAIRKKILPFAKAQGLLTVEELFRAL